jgi:general secretion pathway protein K
MHRSLLMIDRIMDKIENKVKNNNILYESLQSGLRSKTDFHASLFLPGRDESYSEKGFALMIVIMVLLVVSFLAGQLIMVVRTEQKIPINQQKRHHEFFICKAAIELALFNILDKPLDLDQDDEKFVQGFRHEFYLPTGKGWYQVSNESGKIDLNKSPKRLLELFFEYQKFDEEQILAAIDSLHDWRDSDDLVRLNGAENDTYESLEPPYTPRNGNITEPAEIFLINGIKEISGNFKPEAIFTVNNKKGKINFNSLPVAVLAFLADDNPEIIKLYNEIRSQEERLNPSSAREILGDERFELFQPFLTYSSAQNKFFSLTVEGAAGITEETGAENADFPGLQITTLVKLEGVEYKYLAWHEGFYQPLPAEVED